ncbi:MAG TPA: AmmeMemoRadiSam system protein B [Candidatus Sulfotelmatobacter sp.]|nr:AmmeMemoRadiSam system protein B [Candidatus Sulfotelmatobacter sp.]
MFFKLRPKVYWLAAPLIAILAIAALPRGRAAGAPSVRPAAVAGGFYPADPKELSTMIDDMLAHASPPPIAATIVAAVAPHAGYPYSGPVAAYTYAALKGHKFARVVVIAPSHFEAFDFTSVFDGDAYATPLGNVPVDKTFAQKLAKMSPTIRLSSQGHLPTPAGAEHALEVELPWLQRVLGDFQLVPVVMGDQSYESSRALGVALSKMIQGNDTLILASSDLSHYHPYDEAVKIDHKTLNALQAWDYFSLSQNFEVRVWEACGGAPIVAAMIAAERMGANQAAVLKYANSGDTTGDRSRVVGYSADVFLKTQARTTAEPQFSLTSREKDELLALARKSVEYAVREKKAYDPVTTSIDTLNQERGAFVTLTKAGELRGCIGYTSALKPLYVTVRETATFAALRDPRFPPVSPSELSHLEYEISVLSPMRRVLDIRQIKVGQHGLLMKNGTYEGLLLPQVPVEQKWDRQQFLEETCMKAGMSSGCWKDENTDIFMFTAVVFGQPRPEALTPETLSPLGVPSRPGAQAPGSPPH